MQDFIFWGRQFQRDAPAKDMLVLNKSSLGLGTYRLFLELVIVGLVDKLTSQIVPNMLFNIWGH